MWDQKVKGDSSENYSHLAISFAQEETNLRRPAFFLAVVITALSLPAPHAKQDWPLVPVVETVDGDTIKVKLGSGVESVRLIGVDTPETVHPTMPNQPFGAKASAYTRAQLLGKQVYLEFDQEGQDKYGHTLAYVWTCLPEQESPTAAEVRTGMFNARLLLEGYALVLPIPPNCRYVGIFSECQIAAKEAGKGLWGLGRSNSTPAPGVIVVYVTTAGSKYHAQGCRFLAKSCIQLPLAEAKARGYTPCGVCKPPE